MHGRAAADAAAETARQAFEEGASAEGLPVIVQEDGAGILTVLVNAGLASSNGEARRAIAGNSISIDDVRVTDPNARISLSKGQIKLSMGKKKHVLVKPA